LLPHDVNTATIATKRGMYSFLIIVN